MDGLTPLTTHCALSVVEFLVPVGGLPRVGKLDQVGPLVVEETDAFGVAIFLVVVGGALVSNENVLVVALLRAEV